MRSVKAWRIPLGVATATLVLAACAARDPYVAATDTVPAGSWRIERQIDRITGAPIPSALAVTHNSSNSAVTMPQQATLQLTCFGKQPIVRVAFVFKVGSDRNSIFGYRFDEKPGHEIEVRSTSEHRTLVIEDPVEVARFADELATSATLYLRIRSITAGRSTADFRVDGGPEAIRAGFADCPLPPPAAQPPARRPAVPARSKH